MEKTNHNFGNTRKGFEDTANINIEREVSELIKKGADKASMNEVRRKFGDDKIFDMVQEAYFEKLASIRKRSIKFTKLIERKYGMYGHPLHIILNKALKYKKKYNLSEEEFELFRQYYQKTMNMRNNASKYDVLVPNTNMAKVFGDDPYTNNKIHVSDGDHRLVKDILALYDMNRALWQQVTLQSITYESKEMIDRTFGAPGAFTSDPKTTNFSSFIHPVIAAMFLPKIARFDEYFLFTNLAYILRCKYLGEPISTFHSYLMLYNLVTDPTDVVCNADSPLKDILNRVMLQVTLWKNVLRLRHGGVYDTHNSFAAADLMAHIDNCKLSTYDAPDLLMIGDENVVIRRLLSALAFRCATVFSTPTTIPLFNPNGQNPNMQVSALNIPINFTQVTKVPMIYIRLPPVGLPTPTGTNVSELYVQDALSTVQPIMYNGKLESRMMSVVGNDGVLIVSIPRRTYRPISGNIYNLPQVFNMSNMPNHAFGLETLNTKAVYTNMFLTFANMNVKTNDKNHTDKLFIKSVVSLKQKDDNTNKFIYGSKTYIFNYENTGNVGSINVYDPITTSLDKDFKPIRKVNEGAIVKEKDQVADFVTNQTIIIYTNELINKEMKNISDKYDKINTETKAAGTGLATPAEVAKAIQEFNRINPSVPDKFDDDIANNDPFRDLFDITK
jgi:hypothetical protein